jgi:hypothetical protein
VGGLSARSCYIIDLEFGFAPLKLQVYSYVIRKNDIWFTALIKYPGRTTDYRRANLQIGRQSGGVFVLLKMHVFYSPCLV